MSAHRILLVENPAELAIRDGRLRLRRKGMDDAFVLPEDIAVLVLHHHTIRLSVHVLRVLAQAGSMVLVTDANHLPAGLLWPWGGGSVLVRRLRQQMVLDGTERQAVLWGQLVQGRIATQAMNLRYFGHKGALRLERLSRQVEPGDPSNLEAQASRHYWRHLLPSGVLREKHGSTEHTTFASISVSPCCAPSLRGKSPRPDSIPPSESATTVRKIRSTSPTT